MRKLSMLVFLTCLPFSSLPVSAAAPGNVAEGEKLHSANCTGCHDTKVYSRSDRKVKSMAGLKEQMAMCGHAAKLELSESDKQNLVKYLNERFYRFN